MTNEEMTLEALKLCKKTRIFIPANEYLDIAINSLQENTKLKSELKSKENNLIELRNLCKLFNLEIDRLKSELEQSEIARNKQISVLIQEIKQLEAIIEAPIAHQASPRPARK